MGAGIPRAVGGERLMAWLDDRIWAHPKLTELSDRAFRVWVNGVAYSSGFGTRGKLTEPQQRLVGASPKIRAELVDNGLWERNGRSADVLIHDWGEHNAKRDERREKDRERKRRERRGE